MCLVLLKTNHPSISDCNLSCSCPSKKICLILKQTRSSINQKLSQNHMSKNQSTNQLIRYICITKFTKKAGICTDFPGRIYIPTLPGQCLIFNYFIGCIHQDDCGNIIFIYFIFYFFSVHRRQLIISMNENPLIASANLQTHSDLMENWYIKQSFKLNHSKSIHTTFTRRPAPFPEVTLYGSPIPSSHTVKYLGLDKRLL